MKIIRHLVSRIPRPTRNRRPKTVAAQRSRAVRWTLGVGLSLLLSLAPLAAEPTPPCCRALAPSAPFTERSLYQLDSTWTSDVGREVKLAVLRGRPQVVAMFFTSCEYACPIIVHEMKRIEESLPASLRGKVDFLLVSFDTERDTPAALHTYRARQQLATERWTLLRGGADDVRELAALLGINFQKDARGQFAHSNLVTVLNGEGEVIYQLGGLKQDVGSAIDAIERASAQKSQAPNRDKL